MSSCQMPFMATFGNQTPPSLLPVAFNYKPGVCTVNNCLWHNAVASSFNNYHTQTSDRPARHLTTPPTLLPKSYLWIKEWCYLCAAIQTLGQCPDTAVLQWKFLPSVTSQKFQASPPHFPNFWTRQKKPLSLMKHTIAFGMFLVLKEIRILFTQLYSDLRSQIREPEHLDTSVSLENIVLWSRNLSTSTGKKQHPGHKEYIYAPPLQTRVFLFNW